jgi:hypothetical protein
MLKEMKGKERVAFRKKMPKNVLWEKLFLG